MKEKIQITIENVDDIQNVLQSLELLFTKLIYYYAEKDLQKLYTFVLGVSVYFGQILDIMGYRPENNEGEE